MRRVQANPKMGSLPGGKPTKWEEIGDGERALTEYHVRVARGGDKYKVMLSPGGKLIGIVREIPSKIEVPVD